MMSECQVVKRGSRLGSIPSRGNNLCRTYTVKKSLAHLRNQDHTSVLSWVKDLGVCAKHNGNLLKAFRQ